MRFRDIRDKSYWHGSDIEGIKTLTPKFSSLINKRVVFAAIYPEVAVAMSGNPCHNPNLKHSCGHWNDSDFEFGRTLSGNDDPDTTPYVMRELKKGKFEKFFTNPICLYRINSSGFHSDSKLQDFELISTNPTDIFDDTKIENPLEYLQDSKMIKIVFYQ